MSKPDYVHLHLHSHFSVLDGVCQIEPLLARVKELGMKEVALTDHGAMFGVLDFYMKAEKKGIKPILGFEAYVAPGSRHEKSGASGIKDATYHLTMLAKDFRGYQNLSRLCSLGYTEGFYYRPRVDKEILREFHDGIIALSGCLSGEVSRHVLNGRMEEAEAAAREYLDIFGEEHFYLEIQDNGLEDQQRIIPPMAELSKKLGIPLVATSDVHYILPEHARVQDVLLCINTGKQLSDENRMKMDSDEFYLKSPEQMRLTFKGYEDACDRTVEIARRCNVDLDEHKMMSSFHLPVIKPPSGDGTPEEYLEELCQKGLRERYGDPLPEAVVARYEKEKSIVVKMGFPSYFLMVWEIVNFARSRGIPVGTRGSAAGSIIGYALKISTLDPLEYGLLFERFLNEGRNEMPDIDLDIDKERRQEVVDYIIERYGRDQCAQIVTFGKISAKSAVRDVGRVMGVPLHEVNTIAKMIPDMLKAKDGKNTIQIAMELNPDLKELHDKDPQVREMLDLAGNLDGVIRQTGIHAAGVLVSDVPITDYGPLAATREGDITTQYDMKMLEKMGLCKVDCLGLETLTLLRKAVANVQENAGVDIDIERIPLDDEKTYSLFQRGDTKGIFQFESAGMRDLLVKLKPDCIDHLNAACAMYRPGPMQFIDQYVDCRHGKEQPQYLHPLMEPLLRETYGLIIYQEQVQALALELAHFTLSEGDLMRRAMGKKIRAIMEEYREKFIQQADDTVGSANAEKIFDQIEFFAGYGFNKSHSACYAVIAYQTAYLKAHYPKEYMAALLTTNRGNTDKVVEYIKDAEHMGIEVLPPDVNESHAYFTVAGDNIRFGLSAVKGVGDKAVEMVASVRGEGGPFKSLHDFCERIDLQLLNKGAIEALIKAGAFDSLGGRRSQYMAVLESAIAAGNAARRDRASGQMGLFGAVAEELAPTLPDVPEWPDTELSKFEKEVMGFHVTVHPLDQYVETLQAYASHSVKALAEGQDGGTVTVGGMIASAQLRNDKRGNRYALVELEDLEGSVTVWVFSSVYEEVKDHIAEDRIVFVRGTLDRSRDEPSIKADDVIPLEESAAKLTTQAVVSLDALGLEEQRLDELGDILNAHRGRVPVFFRLRTKNRCLAVIKAGRDWAVTPGPRLTADLDKLLGEGHLAYCGRVAG